MEEQFADYARYYDLLYQDKDYIGEADYIGRMIQRFCPGAHSILELGSGTGRHAALLADRGYQVHGIERSEEMLAHARRFSDERQKKDRQWQAPSYSHGDIRSARVQQTFDAAMSLFHVLSYQTGNDDIMAALTTARAHLKDGGLFLFDVWYGPTVLTERPTIRIKRMKDNQSEVTRIAEPVLLPSENVVEVNYSIFVRHENGNAVGAIRETHRMRYFFLPELAMLLGATGFRMTHTEEWMTGNSPTTATWGVCVAAIAI